MNNSIDQKHKDEKNQKPQGFNPKGEEKEKENLEQYTSKDNPHKNIPVRTLCRPLERNEEEDPNQHDE